MPTTDDPSIPSAKNDRRPHLWVSTSYFAEGFPYTVVNAVPEVLFKELGASLHIIGLTSLFHLPWNLKFLWGPFLDQYETKRRWLLGLELLLSIGLVALAFVAGTGQIFTALSLVFALLAFLSATHDVAIDGYYLEALDEEGQSRFVGYRAMAYRLSMLLVSGPLLMLCGKIGWRLGLLAMAAVMFLLLAVHILVLPKVEKRKRPLRVLVGQLFRFRVLMVAAIVAVVIVSERQLFILRPLWQQSRQVIGSVPGLGTLSVGAWIAIVLLLAMLVILAARRGLQRRIARSKSAYAASFVSFVEQPKVAWILAFVVSFRAGESLLQKMKYPFLHDQMQMTLTDYGQANGTIGIVASFTATLIGGWLIARQGLRRWIWPFVLGQNLLNLLYVALASTGGEPPSMTVLTTVIALEHFGAGLGTAVFMVYLMRCCDPAHKAAHMAIVTALMSVSFTIAGILSGFAAEAIGFSNYFALSFLATIPGMALIFAIPHLDGRESSTALARTGA